MPAVLVADAPEHQAFERVHAHPHRPLLPADQVALHLEARALRLGDLQRFEVAPERPVVLGVVAARLGRERHDAEVDDLEHLATPHVDVGHETLEGAGVAVVLLRLAQIGQAARDATVLLVGQAERAGRPGIDLHEGAVDDAAPVEGRIPLVALVQRGEHHDRLLDLERRPHATHDLPVVDGPPRHRDDRLGHVGRRALDQVHPDPAVLGEGFAGIGGAHRLLRGFTETEVGEAHGFGIGRSGLYQLAGGADLVCSQRGQGMWRAGRGHCG